MKCDFCQFSYINAETISCGRHFEDFNCIYNEDIGDWHTQIRAQIRPNTPNTVGASSKNLELQIITFASVHSELS